MAQKASDVVVIGSGVVGTAAAYFLARQGAGVTVVDGDAIGSGASLHGTGMVWKLIWNHKTLYKLAKEGRHMMLEEVPWLHGQIGIDPLLHIFDTIVPFFDDDDEEYLRRDVEIGDGDVEVDWLGRDDVLKLEPRISPDVVRGALLKGSAQVDGYRLTLAQARAAENHGATFLTRRATGLEVQNGRVTAMLYPGGRIPCGAVVIAMGAWSGMASEWLDFAVPIKPLKGETIRVRHPDPFPYQVAGAVSPRKDGLLSLGATGTRRFSDAPDDLVRLDYDARGTPEGRDYMLRKSMRVVPDLERAEVVDHMAGPRPLSAAGMPIIGPVPTVEGAYVAMGHRNKGIHLATITARIIADLIVEGKTGVETPLDIFLPRRFAQREVEFNVPGVTV